MFEAALRILESESLGALTTNRIAAVAGVSIGTLYQYFPDKDALLLALVKREVEKTFVRLDAIPVSARTAAPQPATLVQDTSDNWQSLLATTVHAAVRIMLGALDGRLHARKRLLQALASSGHAHLIDEEIMKHGLHFLTSSFSSSGPLAGFIPNLDFIQRFVLARAVSGALRAALLHDENLLQDAGFEDALCRLILGFLMHGTGDEGSSVPGTAEEKAGELQMR